MTNQTTITKNNRTALITTNEFAEDGETIRQITVTVWGGFNTSAEVCLKSHDFKSDKAATKWANSNL